MRWLDGNRALRGSSCLRPRDSQSAGLRYWHPATWRIFRRVRHAGRVAGQQPGPFGIGERRSRGILVREYDLAFIRPADTYGRVKRIHAMLDAGSVRRRAQVGHRSIRAERHEGMPEPLGNEDRPPRLVVEAYLLPVPVGRRTERDVHDYVEDRPAYADYVLRLPRRNLREMNPRMTPRQDTEQLAWPSQS
jgi:hypothetical protein